MTRATYVSWEAPTRVDRYLPPRERALLALRRAATALRCAQERHPTTLRAREIVAIEIEIDIRLIEWQTEGTDNESV